MGLDNGLRIKGKTIKGKKFLSEYCKDIKDSLYYLLAELQGLIGKND